MYMMIVTINVVTPVNNVRLNVWLTLRLTIPSVTRGLLPRTSRTRSKTTIVSLTE